MSNLKSCTHFEDVSFNGVSHYLYVHFCTALVVICFVLMITGSLRCRGDGTDNVGAGHWCLKAGGMAAAAEHLTLTLKTINNLLQSAP